MYVIYVSVYVSVCVRARNTDTCWYTDVDLH